MIRSVTLKNFQSHKNSSFVLSEGVNVIVGPSDNGKSSIVRAVRLVAENRPNGDDFRSNWGGETRVVIETGYADVHRIKSDKDNQYIVEGRGIGGADILKAFGQSVPEEVSDAINLSQINFQDQHDSPFLLSESPGEVARYLNKIVKLDKIDSSLLHANKRIKTISTDISYKENEIKQLESDIESYDWVESADKLLSEVESLQKQYDVTCAKMARLEQLSESINKARYQILVLEDDLKSEPLVNKIYDDSELLAAAERNRDRIETIIGKITIATGIKQWSSKVIEKESDVKAIEKDIAKLESIKKDLDRLEDISESIHFEQMTIYSKTKTLEDSQAEFDKLMPDVCPLCGRSD